MWLYEGYQPIERCALFAGFINTYKVFENCNKIEVADGFFENMDCILPNGDINNITLPKFTKSNGDIVNMFEDCVNLKNISRMFSNLKNVHYQLNGEAFKKCQLTNVSYLFDNSIYKGLYGQIPFKLFYQEDEYGCVNATITNMSYVFNECNGLGCTYYTFNGNDTDLYEKTYNYEGEIVKIWNPYVFDGTRDFYSKRFGGKTIQEIKDENNLGPIPVEFSEGYVTGESFDINKNFEDLGNEEYTQSDIERLFTHDNYFCPPDIFKYCVNTGEVNVTCAFYRTSNINGGIYGKIPPFIFKPISKTYSLTGVFHGCNLLLPYSWGREISETVVSYGLRYPEGLLDGLTKLTNVNNLFSENIMWGKTETKFDLFPSNIMYMYETFSKCTFINSYSIFSGNLQNLRKLFDVTAMLRNTNVTQLPIPPIINKTTNPNVARCSDFMRNCSTVTNTAMIPRLWEYTENLIRIEYYLNAFYGTSPEVQNFVRDEVGEQSAIWWLNA